MNSPTVKSIDVYDIEDRLHKKDKEEYHYIQKLKEHNDRQ